MERVLTNQIKQAEALENLAALAERMGYGSRAEFLSFFREWRTAGSGQVLSLDDAIGYCKRKMQMEQVLPWGHEPGIRAKDYSWQSPQRLSATEVSELPKVSGAQPGDYIVYRHGGPVYRVLCLLDDGTFKTERVLFRIKIITRPEEFRLAQRG